MSKSSSVFVCQNCGYESPKWLGQCPSCNSWNSFEETVKVKAASAPASHQRLPSTASVKLSDVDMREASFSRITTTMHEFDRVLGGGIVPGEIALIGGEPGIGKSTLLTHVVLDLATHQHFPILYVCGEESPQQIALRIDRLQIASKDTSWKEQIQFCPTTDVDEVIAIATNQHPSLLIIDSIQSMTTDDLTGSAGSIGQLKECTDRLTRLAKQTHIPTFLVGHVTKEGSIAGPKVLEHIVDAVLELSGERTGAIRLLRAIKNRFGATDEVGVFQVADTGLVEVSNPSQLLLTERQMYIPGSCLACVVEGTRPIIVEIQALVVPTQLAIPRRVGRGIAPARLQLLTAVLQKHAHLPIGASDVFVNVAGGFTVNEPAVDLAIAFAIASSHNNTVVPNTTVCIGEVGLLGEIRSVSYLDKRAKEAKRLGFENIISAKTHTRVAEALKTLKLTEKESSFVVHNGK